MVLYRRAAPGDLPVGGPRERRPHNAGRRLSCNGVLLGMSCQRMRWGMGADCPLKSRSNQRGTGVSAEMAWKRR